MEDKFLIIKEKLDLIINNTNKELYDNTAFKIYKDLNKY